MILEIKIVELPNGWATSNFAQWRYTNQWSIREVVLLLVENYSQYPGQMTWNIVICTNFWTLFRKQFLTLRHNMYWNQILWFIIIEYFYLRIKNARWLFRRQLLFLNRNINEFYLVPETVKNSNMLLQKDNFAVRNLVLSLTIKKTKSRFALIYINLQKLQKEELL